MGKFLPFRLLRHGLTCVGIAVICGMFQIANTAAADSGSIFELAIDGPIGPATSDFVTRALDRAHEANASLVVLTLDTPGGLDTAMRAIIKKIISSPVAVASFVYPSGSRAASAGTYILYASHVAAMAPATNLGAATPIQIGAPGIGPAPDDGAGGDTKDDNSNPDESDADEANTGDDEEEQKEDSPPRAGSQDTLSKKMVNDAVAYIRGLARMRGRNEQWAEKSVRDAASLPAEEALERNVIDFIARDVSDLLEQLNGHEVNVLGQPVTLKTDTVTIERILPDWRSQLLSIIANPNIAYVLMLIGIYGLIFELANPGALVPGTIGAICLLLALYAFQVLPINYTGFALILLGIGLMAAEAFAPSFGILGLGGLAAFLAGSILLIDTDVPGLGIDLALIGAFAITSGILFIIALGFVLKARRHEVVSGREEMIGAVGIVMDNFDAKGQVRIHSEIWKARAKQRMQRGQSVKVIDMDGLTLLVTPADSLQETNP